MRVYRESAPRCSLQEQTSESVWLTYLVCQPTANVLWPYSLYTRQYQSHLTSFSYVSSFVNISFQTCELCYANGSQGQAAPFLPHALHASWP